MDPPDAPDDLRRDAEGTLELELEPSGSGDDDVDVEGGVVDIELRPLVVRPRPRYSGPADAPEDNVTTSPSSAAQTKVLRSTELPASEDAGNNVAWSKIASVDGGANPNVEAVASMMSNEGIQNGIQRLTVLAQQGYATVRDRAAEYQASRTSNDGTAAPTTTVATTAGVASDGGTMMSAEHDHADSAESTKKKKMFLLLLIVLFVALTGAVLSKFAALEAEENLEEGESEMKLP